jgi:hypothetical protein
MSEAVTTQDHETIRQWARERNGHPATVKDTQRGREEAGLLRIDFDDGEPDDALERISWDAFFEKFDEEGLSFLYQEEMNDGSTSRFCKFIDASQSD